MIQIAAGVAVNGLHLNAVAKAEHKRFLRRTSELHWRSDTTNRLRNRRRNFRMTDKPPFVTRNPDEERREFNRRLIGSDTALGRSRNAAELSAELPPDLPEENYRILSLLTQRGSLKYDPMQMTQYEVKNQERGYRWPAWKVRILFHFRIVSYTPFAVGFRSMCFILLSFRNCKLLRSLVVL